MPATPVMHYRQKFSSAHDIAAITVNRWPHGYGYATNSLFDGADYEDTLTLARQPFGRVSPLPIPTLLAMLTPIWPSTRPSALYASSCSAE